ncbi:MAG: cysteine desulfurase-like protein [Acidobacteria bacterium]|nr:cysteine desulfurase-like protein [Acidobacteriota bacterium]
MRGFDAGACRAQFPGLARHVAGRPAAFFDGPGGSQVPARVIDATSRYLAHENANSGGPFATSEATDALLDGAHRALADFVGTPDPGCIAFGANMTTLTLALGRALARTWRAGDEVVVTQLDHDANVTPWVLAARDAGAEVREARIQPGDGTLDLGHLGALLSRRTRLVAVTCASNAIGTMTDARRIAELAHAYGALVFLDAVHYAPHALIDVAAWDCDFLCCSAYKFFGPHVGVMYGKREQLERLPAYKVRPAGEDLPHRWETGTLNHEGIAGAAEAVEYLADIGRRHVPGVVERRAALRAAFEAIREYEGGLTRHLLERLTPIPGVRLHGIRDPHRWAERTPTVSFTHERLGPREVATRLGREGIFVWHGNFYALRLTEVLGLEPDGVVRVGLLHYNTRDEIDRLAAALNDGDARP